MLNTVLINPDFVSLTLELLTNSEILFLLTVIKPHISSFRINVKELYFILNKCSCIMYLKL